MPVLEIKNLMFRYKNKFIYDNFNLSVEKGQWLTIAGPNGSGKTTLVKILSGLERYSGNINIFDKKYNRKNWLQIKKEIGFVFDNPDNYFACETVSDELAFSLENLAIMPSVIKKKIKEISKLLKIDNILNEDPSSLSGGEKQKVALACALMLEPRILILDDALSMIDINTKGEMLKILRDLHEHKRITIISLSHELDEAIYSDRLVILNKGKIVVDGPYPDVFDEERVMRKIGLEVPFTIELCKKLKVYDILDEVEPDLKTVVDKIWK